MSARLVWITPDAEKLIAYCARVSSPNQENPEIARLLQYCIVHKHWSIFEMASACFEIVTSRAISAQICRHKSFSVQEFSTRYSKVQTVEKVSPRRQDTKNRQNSIDDLSKDDKEWFRDQSAKLFIESHRIYEEALNRGIAKECARFLLPMASTSRLYMAGTIRSWIHYTEVRTSPDTQLEHRVIAQQIQDVLLHELPITFSAVLENRNSK